MSRDSVIDSQTGRPRLLSVQCGTCVGRPGNLMHLRPGRLAQLIRDNCGPEALGLVCHETLSYGPHPDFGPAFCRWFFDRFGLQANGIRCLMRLGVLDGSGGFTEVDPPEGETDAARDQLRRVLPVR
jgi:hypothetical protein